MPRRGLQGCCSQTPPPALARGSPGKCLRREPGVDPGPSTRAAATLRSVAPGAKGQQWLGTATQHQLALGAGLSPGHPRQTMGTAHASTEGKRTGIRAPQG